MADSPSTVFPALRYRDAYAAIDWLSNVFGFKRHVVYEGPPGSIAHAELSLHGGMIMLGSAKDDEHSSRYTSPDELDGVETRGVYIFVEDVDAAYRRAVEAQARILRPLQETAYGSKEFAVKDPEGHSWGVGSYNPWAAHS